MPYIFTIAILLLMAFAPKAVAAGICAAGLAVVYVAGIAPGMRLLPDAFYRRPQWIVVDIDTSGALTPKQIGTAWRWRWMADIYVLSTAPESATVQRVVRKVGEPL
jgi:hypothetical protein